MKLLKPALLAFAAYVVVTPPLAVAAALHAQRTLVSVPSEPIRGMPSIELRVNGKGPFRFAIDTGAPGEVHIDTKLADLLGLKAVREETMGDPSGENDFKAPVYRLSSLTIGRHRFPAQEAVAHDFTTLAGGKVTGMFGMATFADHILVLDYAADRVEVQDGALPPADNRTVFDIVVREDGLIEIPITISGEPTHAILDTGNVGRTGVIMSPELAAKFTRGDAKVSGKMHTVSNTRDVYTATLAGEVRIGEAALPVTSANYPGAGGPEINIGSAALKGARLRLDQRNKRIEVTWPKGAPAAP